MAPGYIDACVRGLVQSLDVAGIGVYREAGYPASEFPADGLVPVLTWTTLPPSPDRAISVRFYQEVPPVPAVGLVQVLVQVRVRTGGDPNEGLVLQGRIAAAWHEKALALPTGPRVHLTGSGLAYLGADPNGRHEYTRNFRVDGDGLTGAE